MSAHASLYPLAGHKPNCFKDDKDNPEGNGTLDFDSSKYRLSRVDFLCTVFR